MNKSKLSLFSLLCLGTLILAPGCHKKDNVKKNKKSSHITKSYGKNSAINENISIDDVKEFLPEDNTQRTEAEIVSLIGKS